VNAQIGHRSALPSVQRKRGSTFSPIDTRLNLRRNDRRTAFTYKRILCQRRRTCQGSNRGNCNRSRQILCHRKNRLFPLASKSRTRTTNMALHRSQTSRNLAPDNSRKTPSGIEHSTLPIQCQLTREPPCPPSSNNNSPSSQKRLIILLCPTNGRRTLGM
jgi:hypothetical protein